MGRQNFFRYDDGSGRATIVGWFDPDKARSWGEGLSADDTTRVSLATGSALDHQRLWKTTGGRWIVASWSERAGVSERWYEVSVDAAKDWLVRCEYKDQEVVAATREPLLAELGRQEAGRPEVGPRVVVRLPEEVIARVDELARSAGVSRAAWLRAVVESATR